MVLLVVVVARQRLMESGFLQFERHRASKYVRREQRDGEMNLTFLASFEYSRPIDSNRRERYYMELSRFIYGFCCWRSRIYPCLLPFRVFNSADPK